MEPDEGRNAEVAREMLASGDWVTPHFDTFPYLDKPPVFFWMVAGSLGVFGVSEWAARLPSALSALALVLLTGWLAWRMLGGRAGLGAGWIVATCPLAIVFSHMVIFDMTLACLVTLAMVCFWRAEASDFKRPALDAVIFTAMGAATLTKGPVGFLLPILSWVAYGAVRRRLGELKRLRWGMGILIFLAICLPWFITVSVRHPDFPRYAFWQESLKRFATGTAHRQGGLFYYLPVYLAGFFPWSLFLLFAGLSRVRRWRALKEESQKPVVYLLCWALVTFTFFSLSQSKLPGYILPAIPPLAILTALVWGEARPAGSRAPDWLTAGFAAFLAMGLFLAVGSQPWVLAATKLRWARKLHPALSIWVKPSLLYGGLILIALAILGRNLAARLRGTRHLAAATFLLAALTVPILVVRWWGPIDAYAETHSSRRLAETLLASPEKDLPLCGYYYFRTSLPFYLRRPVALLTEGGSELTSNYIDSRLAAWPRATAPGGSEASAGPTSRGRRDLPGLRQIDPGVALFLNWRELRDATRSSPQPWVLLVRNDHVGELEKVVGAMDPLWNEWEYSVWKTLPGSK